MTSDDLWSLKNFLALPTPEKEALIPSLLFRRDLVALAGRRRNGKTTFILNLSVSLASGKLFIGYEVPQPRRVIAFLLEDDTREIQDKVRVVVNGSYDTKDNLFLFTREYFSQREIKIGANSPKFINCIHEICESVSPDCVILDNAAQLVHGDVNNAVKVFALCELCRDISQTYNCALIVPAHPRKANETVPSLLSNPEAFFEEVMGSSGFINTFGSLWGIQRNQDDLTHFLGGPQRVTGVQNTLALLKRDDGWFEIVDDWEELFNMTCGTKKRQDAWKALPQTFRFADAYRICESYIKSKESFSNWLQHCVRLGLLMKQSDGSYNKRTKSEVKKPSADSKHLKRIK